MVMHTALRNELAGAKAKIGDDVVIAYRGRSDNAELKNPHRWSVRNISRSARPSWLTDDDESPATDVRVDPPAPAAKSAENRRYLQRAGGHYVIGEKLRGESKEAQVALARQGRYRNVAGSLEVKEVRVDDGTMRDRFVICRNPDQAERDKAVRDQLITQLEDAIKDSDQLSATFPALQAAA
jgi:hypothetical protein